ncbi:MAG: polysaccharide biosynthesis/export family protein [Ferruginibacter sp.]
MASRFILIVIAIPLLFCISCTSTKKFAYFRDVQDTAFRAALPVIEAPFQKNDLLNIKISSLNAKASAEFNQTGEANAGDGGNNQGTGYQIDNNGNIEIPMLGTITAAGLTKRELKEKITNVILEKKLLLEPVVAIRQLNFDVTILGEVGNPTVINVPSENISLIKALGLAGDLTIYGKRDNILLVREENGARVTRRLNINSSDFLNSPYYYLKPNDVIYVEPNTAKVAVSGRSQQIIPIVFTGISVLLLVLDKVVK